MKNIFKYHFSWQYAIIFISVWISLSTLNSCRKSSSLPPEVFITYSDGTNVSDTILPAGQNFQIEIFTRSGGNNNITNVFIQFEHDNSKTIFFDTGINNQEIRISKILTKSVYDNEKWTIVAVDKNGGMASASFNITRDTSVGFQPVNFLSVTLGAQNSLSYGSFCNPFTGNVFSLNQAFLNQDSIHMLYYYDNIEADAHTVASPNANINADIYVGSNSPIYWPVRNETRYFKTLLQPVDFLAATNDSLLLVSYSELNAKRKAKNLVINDIYSFKTINNKFGLFLVEEVSGYDSGYVRIQIKIQK